MQRVHEGLPDIGFDEPTGIVTEKVCRKSGKLPSGGCYHDHRGSAVITEYFAEGTVPKDKCELHYSWGGIKIPEGEDRGTDDSGYSYSDYQAVQIPQFVFPTITETTAETQAAETYEYGPTGRPPATGIEAPVVIVN